MMSTRPVEYSSESDSSCDSSDTSDTQPRHDQADENYEPNVKKMAISRNTSQPSRSHGPIPREPKRRPNPKIHNRNALMARENRRRKKEYMERIERDVELYRSQNKQLRKDAKKRDHIIQQLRDEQMYLKSVLANKTEIMKLLRTIQGSQLPMTSSTLSLMTDDSSSHHHNIIPAAPGHHQQNSVGSSSGRSPFSDDDFNNGTVLGDSDPWFTPVLNDNFLFTDQFLLGGHNSDDDYMKPPPTLDTWDDLLQVKPDVGDDSWQSNVKTDHNYYSSNALCAQKQSLGADRDPGVCLHVTGGRVSLEFCAACHVNSENAWIEEQ